MPKKRQEVIPLLSSVYSLPKMLLSQLKKKSGFTIAEVIWVFVILCTVISISVALISSSFKTYNSVSMMNEKSQLVTFAYNTLENRLKNAMKIYIVSDAEGLVPGAVPSELNERLWIDSNGRLMYKLDSDEPLQIYDDDFYLGNSLRIETEFSEADKSYLELTVALVDEKGKTIIEKASGLRLMNISRRANGSYISGDIDNDVLGKHWYSKTVNPIVYFSQD